MGSVPSTLLIITVVVAVLALIGAIIYEVLLRTGLIDKAKKKAGDLKFPCILDGDCGATWGLRGYVCDPKIKQCRLPAYESRSCTNDSQCLEITPHCVQSPVLTIGPMCSHQPYSFADLYGDPTRVSPGCKAGLIRNPVWNFCQVDIGGFCRTTDECGRGACVDTTCQFLGPFAVCTDLTSYGNRQCNPRNYCAENPKFPLAAFKCQPTGITPGQDGAYCSTDADCDNKDCYFAAPGDTVGVCASHQALIGMTCAKSSECAQSLDCIIPTGKTTGTCVLSDPANQTTPALLSHCPLNQYTNTNVLGCVGGVTGVPCSDNTTCLNQCLKGIPLLTLGFLGPDQVWNALYPPPGVGGDYLGLFTKIFTLNLDLSIQLNPQYTLLLSPSMLTAARQEDYPTIILAPAIVLPNAPVVADVKGCPSMITTGASLFSSFSTQTADNVMFVVNYDPLHPDLAQVDAILLGSTIGAPGPTVIQMKSLDHLYTDFYVNGNIYNSPADPYTEIYVNCNYHGRWSNMPFPLTPYDITNPPPPWGSRSVFLVPPPLLPAHSGVEGYITECLRVGQDDPSSVGPPQVFSHFFYFPSGAERVVSWKFNVLPSQGNGGLTTLIGLYEVEMDNPTKTRRLVISTLTLYAAVPSDLSTTAQFAHGLSPGMMWAFRKSVFPNTNGPDVYASVYSFVLVDFLTDWPFTAQLRGAIPTQGDTAGTCFVTFQSPSEGTAEMQTFTPSGAFIPGWPSNPSIPGLFAVFTPRAYTRIQATATVRTSQWTSQVLFGSQSPSLLDSDIVVLAIAGRSSIVGITLVYTQAPDLTPQTLLLTMRFGDCTPTSLYSRQNLSSTTNDYANPTRMYTFFLTPEPEETGGGDLVAPPKAAFPEPQVALAPTLSTQISSWDTDGTVDPDGVRIAHQMRTGWASEVFTGCLIPAGLLPPVRFFRLPASGSLSAQGGDNVWVWGRDARDPTSMRFVPLYFDNLGETVSGFEPNGITPGQEWVSASATTCPPSASQAVTGMDYVYNLTAGGTYQYPSWNISPRANIRGGFLQLTGRMCQTQGYQDGLLYRTRPYVFAEGEGNNGSENLPRGMVGILGDPSTNAISPDNLHSMALALSSLVSAIPADNVSYVDSVGSIGVGSIAALLGPGGSVHPVLTGIFSSATATPREVVWVGSECSTAMLPGGYRTGACPVNRRAHTTQINSPYPTSCPDYVLTQATAERKPLPICVIYRYLPTGVAPYLEMHLYDIRTPGTLVSDTTVQMHGGLIPMTDPQPIPSGSQMGYPGFNGGPAVVYMSCE